MIAAHPQKLSREGALNLDHSHGVSPDARALWQSYADVKRHLAESLSVRNTVEQASAQLEAARRDASEPNWDGSGARPVDQAAYEMAKRFLWVLPTTTPVPEVGVDPDGEISVDWSFGRRRILSVSVGPKGRLIYAALIGMSKVRGTEWLGEGAPSEVLNVLARLMRA